MTLCKYRPQRTYDAQFIFEHNDVNGLLKMTRQIANEKSGIAHAYYLGAAIAFETLFRDAEIFGEVDMWRDFVERFEANLGEELRGE